MTNRADGCWNCRLPDRLFGDRRNARARQVMPRSGWQREFEDPIPLLDGRMLVTLRDAGDYIANLRKKESGLPEWQRRLKR
jgi:hypothetical protein